MSKSLENTPTHIGDALVVHPAIQDGHDLIDNFTRFPRIDEIDALIRAVLEQIVKSYEEPASALHNNDK